MNITDKPHFGEPWQFGVSNDPDRITTWIRTQDQAHDLFNGGFEYDPDLDGSEHHRRTNRAISCVNACAGMADPATEIQAMREAIKEAEHILSYYRKFASALSGLPEDIWLETVEGRQVVSALAKLKPLLNP